MALSKSASNNSKLRATTKETILCVASHLLARAAYSEITMDNIARLARVNKATLYYYFKSKAFLIYEVACRAINSNDTFTEPIMASDSSPKEKLEKLIINHIKWRLGNIEIGGITKKDWNNLPPRLKRDYIALRDQYEEIVRHIIREGMDKGIFKQGNNKLFSMLILGLINSIDGWYKQNGTLSIEDVAREACSFILCSLEAKESRKPQRTSAL